MLHPGPARKVTIYIGEADHVHGRSAYAAILEFLFYHGIAGATVTRAIAGFGAAHEMHISDVLRLSGNLPIKIEFIEQAEKISSILPRLRDLARNGVITLQETEVVHAAVAPGTGTSPPPAHLRLQSKAKLMRLYLDESDRWHDRPLHEALVESLRAHDIAGVTVYRGILGYGAGGRVHKDHLLPLGQDRPIMLSVVDTEEKLRAWLPLAEAMLPHGLAVLSDVDVIKYAHGTKARGAEAEEEAAS